MVCDVVKRERRVLQLFVDVLKCSMVTSDVMRCNVIMNCIEV